MLQNLSEISGLAGGVRGGGQGVGRNCRQHKEEYHTKCFLCHVSYILILLPDSSFYGCALDFNSRGR